MKKTLLLIIFYSLFAKVAFTQSPYFNSLYPKSGYDAGSAIEVANGYVFIADIFAPLNNEIVLTRLNYRGDTIWTKIIGRAPKVYSASRLLKTKDGNVVFGGIIEDSVTTNYQSLPDIIMAKININTGDTIWSKRYRAAGQDIFSDITQTKDGGFAIAGTSGSYNNKGIGDFLLLKTDSLGNKQWLQTFHTGNQEEAHSIGQTQDNGYILSGFSIDSTTNYAHFYLVKVDSLGNEQWAKVYGTTGNDNIAFTSQLKDGDYLICGSVAKGVGNYKGYLAKIDGLGNMIWQQNYTFINFLIFYSKPIENSDGSIVISGTGRNNQGQDIGILLKANTVGDTLWIKKYYTRPDFPNYIYNINNTTENGYIFCGLAFDSAKTQYSWVAKVDCMGNDSIHYPPQSGCCGMYSAQVLSNKSNNSFCKGDSIILTISPSYTSYTWSNNATTQSITVKQGGNYTVTIASGGGCTLALPFLVQMDTLPKPVITKSDSVLTSNYSTGNSWYRNGQYIPAAAGQVYIAHTTGTYTYTLVVTNSCGTGTSQPIIVTGIKEIEQLQTGNLVVWPNPVMDGILHIEDVKNTDTIEFYDLLGQKILQTKTTNAIDVSGLAKGVYLLKQRNPSGEKICKIVIQ